MKDSRFAQLAHHLINYSVRLQPGEKVLIENIGNEVMLTRELIRAAYKAGGLPFMAIRNNELLRVLLENADPAQIKQEAAWEQERMSAMQAYIGIRGGDNVSELADLPADKLELYQKLWWSPVHSDIRVKKTKWCILRYPNNSMAQLAGMSHERFEDFYFKVCNLDYSRMSKAMDALVSRMQSTDQVRIVSPGTELSFSIKGIPAIKCDGRLNIPDGEVFTAPVRDSINGTISYNTPSVYQGSSFSDIKLAFKNGKIVEATSNDSIRLNSILDSDDGARFVGEFAIGVNPYILHPMKDTLFDEKIAGSLHLTPGRCYDEASNGNQSSIHWDLVLIQRPDYGGGEIWFDNVLVRKDGLFVSEDLLALNPDQLL